MPVVSIPLSDVGLMTVAEAAVRIGRSVREVQRLVAAGRLPAVTVSRGGRAVYLLRAADVTAFEPAGRGRRPKAAPA